ncbi:MAG: ABC transporter permease, partial [Patescibacteria group bacterium]|nr:ABC transporter permease [Patescibacteria group bacterium]
MIYLVTIIKSALEDFARNKTRTFLTSLGILIGVASVVLLTAFGLGLKKFIQQQFENLGTNLVYVFPGQLFQNGRFRSSGGRIEGVRFSERDILALKRIREIEFAIPVFNRSVTAKAGATSELGDLQATTHDIFPARNLKTIHGETFTAIDVEKRTKVAVIGPDIAKKLFEKEDNAVGRTITIDTQRFKVIGVLESKGGGGFGGPNLDGYIYVPYTAATSFNPDKTFGSIILKARSEGDIPALKQKAQETLEKRYDADAFSLAEQTEILNAISSIFSVLNVVLIAIAAISLIVGGIGIMNIMYVSVAERIREIGIRRALGARKSDILTQFLTESVLLSLFGGTLGLGVSF